MKKIDNLIYNQDPIIHYVVLGVAVLMLAYAGWMVFRKEKKSEAYTIPAEADDKLEMWWKKDQ